MFVDPATLVQSSLKAFQLFVTQMSQTVAHGLQMASLFPTEGAHWHRKELHNITDIPISALNERFSSSNHSHDFAIVVSRTYYCMEASELQSSGNEMLRACLSTSAARIMGLSTLLLLEERLR